MRMLITMAAGMAAAALAAGLGASADAQYFKGKTIEFIVPTAAGGGLGRNALRFANYYKNFIAGKPNVIVKFVPGGGGQKGINFVYNRGKKNGTQLTWGPFNVAGIIAGLPGIRYDPEKFEIIGTTGDAFVTIASAGLGSGLKSAVDLMKSSTFKSGGRIPGGALGMFSVMGFDLLGVPYRHITGYRNQPKMKAALMAREIDTITTGSPGYFAFYKDDLLKRGTARALYYHPPFDVATGKDAPVADAYSSTMDSFTAFYKKVKGKAPSGPKFDAYRWYAANSMYANWVAAPPGTNKEAVAELRRAYRATWADKKTQASFIKAWGSLGRILYGEEAGPLLKSFRKISPEVLAYLKQAMGIGKMTRGKKKK